MTNEQILKKAIEKAVKGGYNKGKWAECMAMNGRSLEFIFQHNFAKAFWGEEENWGTLCGQMEGWNPLWRYNLQHLALEENPLKYLEKFL